MKIDLNLASTPGGVDRVHKDHAYYEWKHPTEVGVHQSAMMLHTTTL